MSNGGADDSSAFLSLIIFLLALVAGTFCSLTSKIMLNMSAIGMDGQMEAFSYPLFQTFGMFLGMLAGLVLHVLVLKFKIPFPGYDHDNISPTPMWMYMMLIFPSVFDLIATCLCMFGLKYVNVSIYQMLRGSAIVFVALLKHFALGDKLKKYMWVGIFWNVVSIVLVGVVSIMTGGGDEESGGDNTNALLGVMYILCGALVQSLQYAFEEKVMTISDDSEMTATPPLLLIGMEGFWGTLLCLFVLYPLAYFLPGDDHGSIENPFNTIALISGSPEIQSIFCLYFFSILSYNILACLVTFMLSSVWHAILDNFRPVTVWGVDLFIYYYITTSFGEKWFQPWSWLQVLGLVILVYGTAIYNAPNSGSIKLTGGIMNCFLDFGEEYEEVEDDRLDRDYSLVANGDGQNKVRASPHYSTISPFMSRGTPQQRRQSIGQEEEVEMGANSRLGAGAKKNYGGFVRNEQ